MADVAVAVQVCIRVPVGVTRLRAPGREQGTQVGMVGINVPIPVPMAFHTFGGWKDSAFGAHGVHGVMGVNFYTQLKTITSRWPTGIREGADFHMPVMGK